MEWTQVESGVEWTHVEWTSVDGRVPCLELPVLHRRRHHGLLALLLLAQQNPVLLVAEAIVIRVDGLVHLVPRAPHRARLRLVKQLLHIGAARVEQVGSNVGTRFKR